MLICRLRTGGEGWALAGAKNEIQVAFLISELNCSNLTLTSKMAVVSVVGLVLEV